MTNDVFDSAGVADLVERINKLTPTTKPEWGRMSVDQMLAHCNVAYEMVYEDIHKKPGFLLSFFLKTLVKKKVVGPDPYPRNSPTAPAFKQTTPKDFAKEKARLVGFLERVQKDGVARFEGRESPSFGALTSSEWQVLFYKHLNHHLTQFGV